MNYGEKKTVISLQIQLCIRYIGYNSYEGLSSGKKIFSEIYFALPEYVQFIIINTG